MRFRHLGHSWFAEGVRACVSVSVCMGTHPCAALCLGKGGEHSGRRREQSGPALLCASTRHSARWSCPRTGWPPREPLALGRDSGCPLTRQVRERW